ncbi:CYFA0S08e04698g1_1 [Cyberlindnera fabianii]|uniref:CYFA0S08e04698g1_1 n=1 Tax=Cyberlindnera fabianii TaxID=36022 RepID=A0A061B5A0_CYBFA|nr:CYFA0S08e04698g1_1 [Cyberlindnera fabianii]
MKITLFSLALAISTAFAADSTSDNDDYKVIGSFIFGRHNDRQSKPAKILTSIGANNQYTTGQFYRKRYFGIYPNETRDDSIETIIDGLNDEGVFVDGEIYCEAPSSNVILFSHYSFLQGLYPPIDIEDTDMVDSTLSELANGSVVENPLDGYQYVKSYIQENATDDYIWIKGDENCPSLNKAIKEAEQTETYLKYTNESSAFLKSLYTDYSFIREQFDESDMTFTNVMSIYDEVYVNSIHNSTVAAQFDKGTIATIKMWAEKYQWTISDKSVNYNLTIGAQTLMHRVVNKLNTTRTTGKPFLNYFTGSYNNMFQLASVLDLPEQDERFYLMPEYGCTYVFELLEDSSNKTFVKFSFKNGTYELGDEFSSYPLFNATDILMAWDDFVDNVKSISVNNVESWCEACGYDEYDYEYIIDMCVPYSPLYEAAVELEEDGIDIDDVEDIVDKMHAKGDDLSLADAGGIGAGVTLGVVGIIGGLGYLFFKYTKGSKKTDSPVLPMSNADAAHLDDPVDEDVASGKLSFGASSVFTGATHSPQ